MLSEMHQAQKGKHCEFSYVKAQKLDLTGIGVGQEQYRLGRVAGRRCGCGEVPAEHWMAGITYNVHSTVGGLWLGAVHYLSPRN